MENNYSKTFKINIKKYYCIVVLLLLSIILYIPNTKVHAEWKDDEESTMETGVTNKSSFDWTLFVPDAMQIKQNPFMQAYCKAVGLNNWEKYFSDDTSADANEENDGTVVFAKYKSTFKIGIQ